ncbi:MAG: DUF1223 domain-containing protein [Paracoccus sp. (in: a-proteobacteria)]|uniref:DUF1223 domain-containing protein n=1 Tax=Paracoccus sp. TaxID=267 RepID=UPI0026E0E7EB|nr:DUF1223 domain-containing protein [Paracoccus sp. (in: a-proteobacteria)]MDO5620128.1 DUF1223 domain-containing protein [Paracoccus sp. (in: a-proteobacteria)]
MKIATFPKPLTMFRRFRLCHVLITLTLLVGQAVMAQEPGGGAPDPVAPLSAIGGSAPQGRSLGPLKHAPIVVELFTSQGCSACPAADQMLADLAQNPDILPLSLHVDYWDYLGWKDELASPAFTRRQKNYAQATGGDSLYTPQIIIGGVDALMNPQPADLMRIIEAQRAAPVPVSVSARHEGDAFHIRLVPQNDLRGRLALVMVRYVPNRRATITAGENQDRTLNYSNVVLDMQMLAEWDGRQPMALRVTKGEAASLQQEVTTNFMPPAVAPGKDWPADTRHALLVQQIINRKTALPGPILAAIRLD